MASPAAPDIERIAAQARAFLEPIWLDWHAAAGDAPPAIASGGTCGRSSLFLCRALVQSGIPAIWRNGIPVEGRELGFLDGSAWRGHAWVEAGGWIVDITADRFGAPPVLLVQQDDPRYRGGGPDTASPEAIVRRRRQVEDIWPRWLDTISGT